MTQKKTQTELVLDYMKAYGSITSLDAYNQLGVTRISARIYDLRAEGHHITSEYIKVNRRNGEETSVKKYQLQKKNQTELSS